MLITISGLSGSGKSSAAKGVSKALGIPTIDVGSVFRAMAKKHRMDVIEFGKYMEEHRDLDRKLDDEMLRLAKKRKNLILQGRLAGLLTAKRRIPAYRVWIDATLATRAKRTALREGISPQKARKNVAKRDKDNRDRYIGTYGLDLNDRSVYDAVIQTDRLSLEEVVSCLVNQLTPVWPTRRTTLKPRSPLKKKPTTPKRKLRK